MKTIKKVTSHNQLNLFEIPESKFAKQVACNDTTCHNQCTCQFADSALQYIMAMNYYCDHLEIWN